MYRSSTHASALRPPERRKRATGESNQINYCTTEQATNDRLTHSKTQVSVFEMVRHWNGKQWRATRRAQVTAPLTGSFGLLLVFSWTTKTSRTRCSSPMGCGWWSSTLRGAVSPSGRALSQLTVATVSIVREVVVVPFTYRKTTPMSFCSRNKTVITNMAMEFIDRLSVSPSNLRYRSIRTT